MNFGIYIVKGNSRDKRKSCQDLVFLERGSDLGGAKETAISSSNDKLTASFSSYFFALFLGFFGTI